MTFFNHQNNDFNVHSVGSTSKQTLMLAYGGNVANKKTQYSKTK